MDPSNDRQCESNHAWDVSPSIAGKVVQLIVKHLTQAILCTVPLTFFQCSLTWQDAYNVVAKEKDREVLGKFDGRIISFFLYKRLKKHPCKAYDYIDVDA